MSLPRPFVLLAGLAALIPASGRAAEGPLFTAAERAAVAEVFDKACDPSLPADPPAAGDEALAAAVIRYATTELGLRLKPAEVDANWAYVPAPHDVAAELAAARAAGRLGPWLQGLSPPDPRYRALAAARCRYRTDAPKLAQIEANLERWRWLPRPLAARRVEVDLGAAEAALYVAGQPTLSMRAIVGDAKHKSPLFASRMSAVVLNPPWNVPTSIAKAEILPKAAKDPGYLARNDFVQTEAGLQQKPGPKNSLGQLKFDFPSPFGVYLHDTPARTLFARDVRTLSHGCMRLEKPKALALALLADQGWTDARIDAVIAAGGTERVDLKGGPPIYVTYQTAVARADGTVDFRRDPYGWDGKLNAALSARLLDRGRAAGGECLGGH